MSTAVTVATWGQTERPLRASTEIWA